MELRTRKDGNMCIVSVAGRIDAVTSPDFEKSCMELIGAGESSLLFDMAGVDYLSSAGLRSILLVAKSLKGGGISFCSLTPNVAHVFLISNFQSIFSLYGSVEEALEVRRGI